MRLLARPIWLTRRIPPARLLRTTPLSAVQHTAAANPARVDLPKLLVKPGSLHHNSLSSFLEHAARTNLQTHRTVYIGTHYEYTSSEALQRFGFSLIRVGQKNDAGIDLVGHWMLSCLREPMPVIVQCKARQHACSPVEIRELEGAFTSVPAEWRNKDVLGVLVSAAQASEGLRKQMYLTRRPVAFLRISRTGVITQFLWNRAAAEKGLEGLGVTPRYTVLPPEQCPPEKIWNRHEVRPRDAKGRWIKDPTALNRVMKGQPRKVITDIQLTWLGTPISANKDEVSLETARLISENEAFALPPTIAIETKRKRGRPLGSKNKPKDPSEKLPQKRGRPRKQPITASVKPKTKRLGGRTKGSSEKYPFDGNGHGEIIAKPVLIGSRGRPRKFKLSND